MRAFMELDSGTVIETEHPEYWKEAKRLPPKDGARRVKEYAIAQLRESLAPGDTVYTVLRNVSRSGMSRRIDLYKMTADGPLYLTGYAANALGERSPDGGLKVDGCGMDMGFHLVYSLSRVLFPEGFGVVGSLPDDAHKYRAITEGGARAYVAQGVKFHGRNGDASGWDNDGGYALSHRWL